MKNYLLSFLLLFCITASASNIRIGLKTSDFTVCNFWENKSGKLTHFLYIYNKTKTEIKISIRLKRYTGSDNEYEEVKTAKTFSDASLPPNQLTKLPYPEKETLLDFMEFFVADKSCGLLNINNDEPDKSFVNDKYKFYISSLSFLGPAMIWLRFVSVSDANTEMSIAADSHMPGDYCLVKTGAAKELEAAWSKLHLLQSKDSSIIKLDKKSAPYNFKTGKEFGPADVLQLLFLVECVQANGKDLHTLSVQEIRIPLIRQKIKFSDVPPK